jgi:hypothetical protein
VEDSLRPRGRLHGRVLGPRQTVVLRFAIASVVAVLVCSFAVFHHRGRQELERTRSTLIHAVQAHGTSLAPDDRQAVARADSWLMGSSKAYEGDLVAPELRAPGAFAAALSRPTVYVHGALEAFRASTRIAEAASTSAKDAFLLCLLEPPAARNEKTLLASVRAAYSDGSVLERRTSNVHRLYAAEVGLPLLLPTWTDRVEAARETWELTRLRKELDRAPLDEATQAASAGLLLFVMDEPGDGPGPTEIDGERSHEVRVGLVDLRAARVVLRLRRRSDPSWISSSARSQYASGLDACRLALDVRDAVPSAVPQR